MQYLKILLQISYLQGLLGKRFFKWTKRSKDFQRFRSYFYAIMALPYSWILVLCARNRCLHWTWTSVQWYCIEESFVCVEQVCLKSVGEMIVFHLWPCDSATFLRRFYPVVLWCSGPILATYSWSTGRMDSLGDFSCLNAALKYNFPLNRCKLWEIGQIFTETRKSISLTWSLTCEGHLSMNKFRELFEKKVINIKEHICSPVLSWKRADLFLLEQTLLDTHWKRWRHVFKVC